MSIEIFERCLKIYEQQGVFELLLRIIKKVCLAIFETNSATWYVRSLNSDKIQIEPNIPLTMHFLSFNETLDWSRQQDAPWMVNEAEIEVARKTGHHWANIKYNGNIVGYIKIGFDNVFITDYKRIIKFPQYVACIYDTFVLSEFRRHKVASYFINETCNFLEENGFTKVLCHIPDWNIASIRAYSNVGFKRTRTILWLKILGFKILTANPAYL